MEQKFFDDRPDDRYPELLIAMQERLREITDQNAPLFLTHSSGKSLNDIYLQNLPEDARGHYSCCACRHFLNRFGSMVTARPDGSLVSALWDENRVPPFFYDTVRAMRLAVESWPITVKLCVGERTLGTPMAGGFQHFSVHIPASYVIRGYKFPHSCAEESKQNFLMLRNAVNRYTLQDVSKMAELLSTNTLYRSAHFLPQLARFQSCCEAVASSQNARNLLWLQSAYDPSVCHIPAGVIGAALDAIHNGKSVEEVTRLWNSMTDPQRYMRAQTAPSASNIQRAEQVVAQLGIASSLRRRYATIEEIPSFLWKPKAEEKPAGGGVFSHITPKNKPVSEKMTMPSAVMSWNKFSRTLLPLATKIEALTDRPDRFVAVTTAEDPEATNILRWDNPFAWYYAGGLADGEIKRRIEEAGGRYENCEIRCSLAWEGGTDLDIHCITPSGKEIYYNNKRVGNGWLDIDANGGHITSLTPVENIRWISDAPEGIYRFFVHNFQERGKGTTPYTVEMQVGNEHYLYNGVAGSTGYRQDVFVFDYHNGKITPLQDSLAPMQSGEQWGVPVRSYVPVSGIMLSPNVWGMENPEGLDSHVFLLLEHCRDDQDSFGRGFFPEMLIPELHEVRKTIDAYCATTPVSGKEQASACGLGFRAASDWNLTLRVTTPDSVRVVKIDRWE